MRKFQSQIFLTIGIVIHLLIALSYSKQTDAQLNATEEGLCVYRYDSNRYTCDLYNAVISSPDEVLLITGNHLPNHTDSDVQAVIHRNVSISFLNGEVLQKFTNLEYLAMSQVKVEQISENAFDVCGKLDHIYIAFNALETLPPRMLQNCVNLRHFDSYFNSLTSIPEDLFGATTNLEIFEVISNQLSSLPPDLLRHMTKLKQFTIRSNFIANIDRSLLANASNLQRVELSSNPISDSSVITNLLEGHETLSSIRINSNRFTSFNFTFFSQFTQLDDLEIGGNPSLTGIDWNGLPVSLTSIYATTIGEEIPSDAFTQLTNLKSLGISGDGITDLHEDTFKQLINLNSLSIHSTGIRTVPSNLFVHQKNVTQLYLSFNHIEELPEGIFATLENLGLNTLALDNNLVLSGNRIRRLNANSFGHHPYLRNIKLGFNEIAEIERELFTQLPNPLETVDLTWNNCTNVFFWYASDLQNDERLQNCFDNWAGITTTEAPSGAAFQVGWGFCSLFSLTFILTIYLM